jgi:hypothetical protein
MDCLTFDPVAHQYRLDGRVIPGVTSVLAPLYDLSAIPRDVLERKRQIGEAVHRAIELDLANDLDDATIDPAIVGYLDAWRRYRRERRYEPIASERRVVHPQFRYAGTLDLFGRALNRAGRFVPVLMDLKTTFDVHPAVALQTAAYKNALMLELREAGKSERMALQLKPGGTYHEEWFADPKDWPTFLSFVTTHNWKATHT